MYLLMMIGIFPIELLLSDNQWISLSLELHHHGSAHRYLQGSGSEHASSLILRHVGSRDPLRASLALISHTIRGEDVDVFRLMFLFGTSIVEISIYVISIEVCIIDVII